MSHKPGGRLNYFPPGLQLPSQPLRGLLPISLIGEQRHEGVNSLPKTVTRQRRGCDLNPGPTAPEASALTTRLPSHPDLTRGTKTSLHERLVAGGPATQSCRTGRREHCDWAPTPTPPPPLSRRNLTLQRRRRCRGGVELPCRLLRTDRNTSATIWRTSTRRNTPMAAGQRTACGHAAAGNRLREMS